MKNGLLLFLIIGLLGCEKKIDFKLDETEPKLVVDGSIENGQPPILTLTRSLGFFSQITPQQLQQSFVHNAIVTVSNGILTHQLKEYEVSVGGGFSLFYYSIDSSNLSTAFTGELEKTYSLTILSDGKEYTASTPIPKITRKIDSLWWKPAPFTSDTNKAVIMVKATDPVGYGDYIRYYSRTNSNPVYHPPMNSVYDDLFIDGTTYEIQLQPGFDRNADTTDKNFFFRGDTVHFKVSNIDRATFDFWRTWEYAISSSGNPFATPNKMLGNISNGALGHFGGYASQYRSIIIPQ